MISFDELIEHSIECIWGDEGDSVDLVTFLENEAAELEFDETASKAYRLAADIISRVIEDYGA